MISVLPPQLVGGRVDSGLGELQRTIGLFQLSMFGIGATAGTGIFIVSPQPLDPHRPGSSRPPTA